MRQLKVPFFSTIGVVTAFAVLTVTPLPGCGSGGDSVEPEMVAWPTLEAVEPMAEELKEEREALRQGRFPRDDEWEGPAQAVVMVVVSGMRADHASLCNEGIQTTPKLRKLGEYEPAVACRAYSPGNWALPSVASLFTGKAVTEHGVDWVTRGEETFVRALADSHATVAEHYKEKGFQTVFISANPLLSAETGLQRGFDHVLVASDASELRGEKLMGALEETLADLDSEQPLFLFFNPTDALDPYPAIPTRTPFAEPQDRVKLDLETRDVSNPYYRFVTGLSDAEAAGPWLERVKAGYAFGVYRADAALGAMMRHLRDEAWFNRGYRVVMTSDHGVHLGERGLVRHGVALNEEAVRVPFVYYDSTVDGQITLREPISTASAFELLKTGAPPTEPLAVRSVMRPNPTRIAPGHEGAVQWNGKHKGVFIDGEFTRYNLKKDRDEEDPKPLEGFELEEDLRALAESVQKFSDPTDGEPQANETLIEHLKTLGYL